MNQLPCSIIIPTWNAKSLIDRCLRSILAHVETGVTEIIVVDDGSTDDTASHINGEFPYVIVERHPKNMGFGVSCNDGVNRATHDIVILLNNDIIADESFLSPLLQHFSDDKVFAVNAQVFQNDGQTPGGGLVRGSLHCGLLRLRWAEYQKARDQKSLTLYANGAATAINKDKFLKLGGFDSIYAPFYSEDLDISYRAYQRGWLVYYEPASKLLHDHSVTINKDFPPDFIKIISKRNRILFIWRNIRSSWLLLQHVVWLCLRCIGAFLTLDFTYLQAVAFALTKLSTVYNRRKADPKVLRSDRQILSLTSDWEYRDIN